MRLTLGVSGWRQAREFLWTQARPVEWAVFQQRFETGSVDAVLVELAKFQNAAGGLVTKYWVVLNGVGAGESRNALLTA